MRCDTSLAPGLHFRTSQEVPKLTKASPLILSRPVLALPPSSPSHYEMESDDDAYHYHRISAWGEETQKMSKFNYAESMVSCPRDVGLKSTSSQEKESILTEWGCSF